MPITHQKLQVNKCGMMLLVSLLIFHSCNLQNSGIGAGNVHRLNYRVDTKYKYDFLDQFLDTLILEKNIGIPKTWNGAKQTIIYSDSTDEKVLFLKEKLELYHFSLRADGLNLLSVFKNGHWIMSRDELKEDELIIIQQEINNTELSALCRKFEISQIPEGNVCL